MSDAKTMTEKLIAEFSENYFEKLFYFCLKKTGIATEAEDLTQDIALNILTQLTKGTIPTNFSAWVWRIARNRYSVWADTKHKRAETVTGNHIGDYEIEDESGNILDGMIHSEQLSLLRRELAFIKSDYRNIVVAYYIENRSVRDIASSLSLSEGTVKQRLYRARTILKEGMDMAREFGIRSYKPEEINYHNNCARTGDKNQPYSIMEHKLYQNIMLEAYGNPLSAEALSLELGIALPYMEYELEYLTRETFLVKGNNKYQTAFPIISRTAQERVHIAHLSAAPEYTKALTTFVDKLNEAFEADNYAYYGAYQDYESAKWTLLMLAYDHFMYDAPFSRSFTERPDNGIWDMIGFQHSDIYEPDFVGNHSGGYGFQQFKYMFNGIADRTPTYITEEEAKVLRDIALGKSSVSSDDIIDSLVKYGYLRESGGEYIPTILILDKDEIKERVKALDGKTVSELTSCAEQVKNLAKDLYFENEKAIRADMPEIFQNDESQTLLAVYDVYFKRGYVMAEALRNGWLLSDDQVSPVIGAHLYI